MEPLEDRVLLAVGPQLIAINPSDGSQLSLDSISSLSVAPRDLIFRFNEGQSVNTESINQGIRIVRSGLDGEFDNSAIEVIPGYMNTGEFSNEVLVRFSETLPDDLYRIVIDGTGDDALKNNEGEAFNDGVDFIIDFELNLGAQVVAVVPQPISRDSEGILEQKKNQIVVYFNDDDLHATSVVTGELPTDPSVVNPAFYQLIATQVEPGSDSVSNVDDVVVLPESISYDPTTDMAVLTFVSDLDLLPSGVGNYRLQIGTNEFLPSPPQVVEVAPDVSTGDGSEDSIVDNDLLPGVPGQFSFAVADGGTSGLGIPGSGVTIEGVENFYVNQNFLFDFANYIQLGSEVIRLGGPGSFVTTPTTPVAGDDDHVFSEGFIEKPNGKKIFWRVDTQIADQDNRLENIITLTAEQPEPADPPPTPETFGELRFINYVDQDIDITIGDDFLLQQGTPGEADFRISARDGADRVGLDQGGIYQPSTGLENATYEGWAADKVFDLQLAILDTSAIFSVAGEIDTEDLPPFVDEEFDNTFGLGDVSTAMSWIVDSDAQVATITTFLELDAGDSTSVAPDLVAPGSSFETALPIGLDQIGILVEGDGSSFVDGQTIVISDTGGAVVTFELNDPSVNPTVAPGRVAIPFASGDSQEDMIEAIHDAIHGSSLDVEVIVFGTQVTLTKVDSIALDPSMAGARVERLDGIILSSSIDSEFFPLEFPGSEDGPGHRDISLQAHTFGVDDFVGIRTVAYNFKDVYGRDPNGNLLHNVITNGQRQRAREVFEIYSNYLGIQFVETDRFGLTIVTGDLRALDPEVPTGPGGVLGLASNQAGVAIMDAAENWGDLYGGSWFDTAMHEIGHLLGLGHTDDLPPGTVMNDDPALAFGSIPEAIFPGDADIIHGQLLHRPESNDIDLYRFELETAGRFSAETIAERTPVISSTLDTVLRLYHEDESGNRTLISQNDDYFSEDSLIEMSLEAGIYYLGVSASGNDNYNPVIEGTGFGGRSQGEYDLRINFRPAVDDLGIIRDIDVTTGEPNGTALDGDADGAPGGVHNFWFQVQDSSKTLFVDKSFQGASNGSLASPFTNIDDAMNIATPGDIVRVVGNGGADGDITTLEDNLAYEIGKPPVVGTLADGARLNLPKGVTLMIDAGAIFKMWKSTVAIGSTSVLVDRSEASLQVLGTPNQNVIFTSYNDQSIGFDTNPLNTTPNPGDWGGLVFGTKLDRAADRFDYEAQGVFLNHVNNADIRYGGGAVSVASTLQVIDPIHLTDSRPTITFNTISFSADAAISANPNSFEESTFQGPDSIRSDYQAAGLFTSGYKRIGPDIGGNRVVDNTLNGLFIRIDTPAGNDLETLTVTGRFNDTDITHILSENLVIQGTPGGPVLETESNVISARTDAQLTIDPGVVIKLDGARIEVAIGSQLLAEGRDGQNIIFTSLLDNRYGAGGTFDTSSDGGMTPAQPGNWSGLYAASASSMSLDHVVVAYGGGLSRVEGSFAGFNALEIHQAEARIANSILEFNASGIGGQAEPGRVGRGTNAQAAIFVRGAQPILVNNIIRDTRGNFAGAININANALNHLENADHGRATGSIDRVTSYQDNRGPLVRDNQIENNGVNGMIVRGATLTTEGVWDDTDIVHVLYDEVIIPDLHTFGGLRLASSTTESLVIKLFGPDAGFTTTGRPLEIKDRIGGMLHVLGQPGHPVVMTSLNDDSVGAGFDTLGRPQLDTDNGGLGEAIVGQDQFDIDINFSPNFLAFPAAVETAELAAAIWEQLLDDPITVVFDFDFADLSQMPMAPIGLAISETVNLNYDEVRNAIIADANPHEGIVLGLPEFEDLQVTFPDAPADPFILSQSVSLTRANAKALGFPEEFLFGAPSQYDPSEIRDARILFDSAIQRWDMDLNNGLQATKSDLLSVMLHEIGHSLGSVSSLGNVEASLLDLAMPRIIQMTTMDMFRFEPGDGGADFTFSPRVLDPTIQDQVFYDGGIFEPTGIEITGLELGDIPLSTGENLGDGFQASHWKADEFLNGINLGIMNPSSTIGVSSPITNVDRRAFDLIGWDTVGTALPRDWRGIDLEQFTHDRNVEPVIETEVSGDSTQSINDDPDTAQFLGSLASNEKASDENLRLGFNIQGFLSKPTDVDVYSFEAVAGTNVWFDIDRTSSDLDVVIELVLSNGTVLARSDNSLEEGPGTNGPFADTGIAATGLQASLFSDTDFYSVNPNDAGLRVALPGTLGETLTYHVRVRSNTPDGQLDNLNAGLTSGAYNLQLRLREVDEFPGTTITYADIRYATNGIVVRGLPSHSPLLGESKEDESENDRESRPTFREIEAFPYRGALRPLAPLPIRPGELNFQEPQNLGNVLASDHAAISVAGTLNVPGDQDIYMFEVAFGSTQIIEGRNDDDERFAEVVFDIDYADGLARADTNLWVYEANILPSGEIWRGELVYVGMGSNDSDDQPRPEGGVDTGNLAGGSFGTLDPFIGSVALAEGFYLVTVTGSKTIEDPDDPDEEISVELVPVDLDQFDTKLATNPFLRLGPVGSSALLFDDRIGEITNTPVLFSEESVVPFNLNDIDLFVSSDNGSGTTISLVDPFLGANELLFASPAGVIADIELRPGSEIIFGYRQGTNDANSDDYVSINAISQAVGNAGSSGIETYEEGPDSAMDGGVPDNADVGVQFEAITFQGAGTGYAVGNRLDMATSVEISPAENVLFLINPDNGAVINRGDVEDRNTDPLDNPAPDPLPDPLFEVLEGIGTQKVELGLIDTMAFDAGDTVMGPGGLVTGIAFLGGQLYAVSNEGGLFQVSTLNDPAADIETTLVTQIVKQDKFGDPILDGMGMEIPIKFEGLTLGPAQIEEGAYADLLFAIDTDGNLYAFDELGDLQGIFLDAERSIATEITDANGLTFSTHQENLWHITEQRGEDFDVGHRFNEDLAEDNDDFRNQSFYFGIDGGSSDYETIGGTYGSIISDAISLDGFTRNDSPTLYFDYFLVTEDANAANDEDVPIGEMADSMRVYFSDESGQWHLLATNNDKELGDDDDDAEVDVNEFDGINIKVQQLFENSFEDIPDYTQLPTIPPTPPTLQRDGERGTPENAPAPDPPSSPGTVVPDENEGVWRQARIDLSDFAGMDDLRLRFEFSTAGSIGFGNATVDETGGLGQGDELRTVPGDRLRDGQIIVLDNRSFEIEMGLELITPSGARITPGETFTIFDGTSSVVFEFTDDGSTSGGNVAVNINDQMSAFDVATELIFSLDSSSLTVAPQVVGNRLQLIGAESVTQDAGGGTPALSVEGDVGASSGRPVVVNLSMTADEVAEVMRQAIADEFAAGNTQVIKSYRDVIEVMRHSVTDPGPFKYSPTLPGDDAGTIFSDRRLKNNTGSPASDGGRIEGAYIDNIVLGFAARGEEARDERAVVGPGRVDGQSEMVSREWYLPEQMLFAEREVETEPIEVGEYQLEIRTSGTFSDIEGKPFTTLDPRIRASQSVTLFAPAGLFIADGQTFTLSTGVKSVTFEYEDIELGNSVAPGNTPIDFTTSYPDFVVAETIRAAINGSILDIVATSPDNVTNGPAESFLINLFGEVYVQAEPAPNGIDFLINKQIDGGENRDRAQGQLLIMANTISHSSAFGIIVEDGYRDLPNYRTVDTPWAEPKQEHGQATTGDYIPHPGPARNLVKINNDSLAPGVVIANNVIADGGAGGINFRGNPNGFVIIAPVGGGVGEVFDLGPGIIDTFSVTDHNGLTVVFEFELLPFINDGRDVQPGNVPVPFQLLPSCICFPRPLMAASIRTAIESTPLDVTVYNGKIDELFIEGAANVTGVLKGGSSAPGWFEPWIHPVTTGAVPFGRIVNNTIVGRGGSLTGGSATDVGILIEDSSSPTILNNIIANFETAIAADNSIQGAVLGSTLFQGNLGNVTNFIDGDFEIDLADTDPLFVDLENGNYYPDANSLAIDSSIDSLEDRPGYVTIRGPLGIAVSPILAPQFDVLGQQRVDDPNIEPPDGVGNNVFKDRGAIDRVDFVGPTAGLLNPLDNDGAGTDLNSAVTVVQLDGGTLTNFSIQLLDGSSQNNPLDGTGVNPLTVTADTVIVKADDVILIEGVDYSFNFDSTNRVLVLNPAVGFWETDTTYRIELDNSIIKDIANNSLQPNQSSGNTSFLIELGDGLGLDFGDAPDPIYPTNVESNGARHTLDGVLFLGVSVDSENNGSPSIGADGDGADEDGLLSSTDLVLGTTETFRLLVSDTGLLDAWIDFNSDGDWNDPGEQIFTSFAVIAGENDLTAFIPVTATRTDTYARFRLSSQGGLAPIGLANDGEVEDYLVSISGNPWQNSANPFDVNGDQQLTPLDALLVINELGASIYSHPVTGELPSIPVAPNVPPSPDPLNPAFFVDVNGSPTDGGQFFLTPLDALLVINELDAQSPGSSEASSGASANASAPFAEPVGKSARDSRSSVSANSYNGSSRTGDQEFAVSFVAHSLPATNGQSEFGESLFVDTWATIETDRLESGYVDQAISEFDAEDSIGGMQWSPQSDEGLHQFARLDRSHRISARDLDALTSSWSEEWELPEEMDLDALDEMYGAYDMG